MKRHIASCSSCRMLYESAMRDKRSLEQNAADFHSNSSLIQMGLDVARDRYAVREHSSASFGRRALALAGSAAILGIVAAVTWFASISQPANDNLDENLIAPVRAAAELASARSDFVIPGGEAMPEGDLPAYRNNPAEQSDSVEAALDQMLSSYQNGDLSLPHTRWMIAGLLASQRIKLARDYATDALRAHGDDTKLNVLAGLAAAAGGDDKKAEDLLRAAIKLSPNDATAQLNLGVFLLKSERAAEGLEKLDRARQLTDDSQLTKRIDALMRVQ